MTAITSGGVPPYGQDMNGALFLDSSNLLPLIAGQFYQYNSGFVATIGGYSLGAVLLDGSTDQLYINESAGNMTNPTGGGGSNWDQFAYKSYVSSVYLTQSNAASTYETQSAAASTYCPLISCNMTGTPTAPTATAAASNGQIATTGFVQGALSSGEAPGSFLLGYINSPVTAGTSFVTVASISPVPVGTYQADFNCDTAVGTSVGNLTTQFTSSGGGAYTLAGGGVNLNISSANTVTYFNSNLGSISGWPQFSGDSALRLSGVIFVTSQIGTLSYQMEVSAGSLQVQTGCYLKLLRVN
jgi:hypothetical protein